MIEDIENQRVPKGRIDLVGFGRLGLRTGINLIQVHRGGPKEIVAFDGQKIAGSDVIFTLLGGEIGEYKTDFLKRICTHDEDYRNVVSIPEYINEDNIDLIKGDVLVIEIAGGNTIPMAAKIIKHAKSIGAKTISTGGIFGYGDEEITVKDISEYKDNPAVDELKKEGILKDHLIVSTNKLLRDHEPITPYTLDEVSKAITKTALRLLDDKDD